MTSCENKSILISTRPQHTCNILNLIKLWEIRKKFPKDYVGWVYIYVTKALPHLAKTYANDYEIYDETQWDKDWIDMNGKVVARFWCDKVEKINSNNLDNFAKDSCLTIQELETYLWSNICCGYAIHITKLEIFDRPKEISEFKHLIKYTCNTCPYNQEEEITNKCAFCEELKPLTRAPQSWCYVEV